MTWYSNFRPREEIKPEEKEHRQEREMTPMQRFVPAAVVGFAVSAALMVLLLLTQSQLGQMSFAISALEQKRTELEIEQEKLLIAHAKAYSLERIEAYAVEKLGMVRPNPDQIRYIDIDMAASDR